MVKRLHIISFLIYICISITLVVISSIHAGTDRLTGLLAFILLIFTVCPFITGILLGVVISAVARKPHLEWRFYLAGQIVAFLAVSAFFGSGFIGDSLTKKPEAGSYDPTTPGYTDEASRPFIQPAFDNLRKRFNPSDSFHLRMYDAYQNDTLNPARRDTTFTVYLVYTVDSAKGRLFYSKYLMGRGGAQLLIFNKVMQSPTPANIRESKPGNNP